MKKFILFFFALVASVCAFAQGTADFNTLKVSTSYAEEIKTANGWVINYSAVQGGVEDPTTEANPQFALLGSSTDAVAVCLNGHTAKVGRITSPKLEGGIGNLSFNYGRFFNDDIDFSLKVEVVQNEEVVFTEDVTIPRHTKCSYKEGGKGGEITLPIKVAGDFVLVITNNCPSQKAANGDRISIWNLTWTGKAAVQEGEVDFDKVNVAAIKQADFVEEGKWYLLKQKRGPNNSVLVTPVHDEGVGVTMKRAAKDEVVVAGTDASDALDYLLRFIPTANEGAYNLQFANGHYWASTMTTTEEEPGEYNVYNINGEATHIGINLYNMDKIVDNNAAGGTLAFWESGEVTKLNGNNDWTVWEVEFAEKSEAAAELKALVDEYEAAFNANNVVVEVGEGIITSTDQFSSPHSAGAEEPKSSLENLLDMDGTTYWHSSWAGEVDNHVHYLQVEFAEPISGSFELNMNRRVNGSSLCANDNPVKMSVETSLDGEEFVLADEFETPFTQTAAAPLVQATVNIPTPAKYLRFFNDGSNGGNDRGYWHCGDFQLKPIVVPAPNAAYPEAAAAFAEALAAAKEAGANATGADVAALQAAYEAYLKGLQPAPAAPVYYTAAQLRENAEKGRFALLGVTATGDHYLNGEAGVDHVSADGTLAGVRDPEANEIVYLVKSGDQYLIQREDTKQFFQIAAGQNIVLVDDATAATPFEIYGKDDAGYATGGFDDLFSDLDKAYDEYMIRFKANGQWLNTQGVNAIGGLRGGTGAWSFQYVRYMGEHATTPVEPEPTAVTFEIAENEDGTFTVTPSDLEATYFYNVYSPALRNQWYSGAEANECVKVDVENYISEPETETHKGVSVVEPASWLKAFYGAEYPYGDYQLVVVAIDQVGGGYAVAGDVLVHNYTYAAPEAPEVTFPVEGVAYKFKNVDSQLYVKVTDDAEQCVTLGTTPDEMYFTKVDGGWAISTSKGYVLGATAKGWNIGNTTTPIVWTIEEVEGGYAFKNEKGYLGYDTAAAGQKAFRDKNYTTHHGVFNIWKYDEEEIIVEPEKTLEETWANIHTLLAEAEAIKELNEVTVTYDGDGYFEDFTSPIVGKVGYKKHDDVWAVCDGADYVNSFVSYFETAAEADAYLADFGGLVALEEIITNVIDDYNAAEVVLPTPGKTYVIRNHPGEHNSYAYYYNGEKLALAESANATTAEYMWTVSEPVKYSYFDADLNLIEETRYQFVNAADNTKFMSWRGNGTDDYAGVTTNAADANSKWYLTGKKVDGSAAAVYGTLALRTNADGNQYRTAVVDMRKDTDHLAKSNGDHFDATYSSWFIFEEVEVPVEPLTFTFADNEDGTITVTPSDNRTYFLHITSDAVNEADDYASDAESFSGDIEYITDADVHTGEYTINLEEWFNYWYEDAEWYTEGFYYNHAGEYRLMAGEVKGTNGKYVQVGEPTATTYEVTTWNAEFEPTVEVADATTVKVTFADAHSVEATNYGVLAAIYDEKGDVYGIVFDDLFGDTVEFGTDCATLHFKKISEINAELAGSAQALSNKVLSAVDGVDVKGKVVICGKSFKIDGESVYTKVIVKDFDFNAGGITTGIDAIAADADAKIFDLQGRRVVLPAKGLFIKDGRKAVK